MGLCMGCGLSHTQKHDRETKSALSQMTENVEQSLQRFGFKSFSSDVHERRIEHRFGPMA